MNIGKKTKGFLDSQAKIGLLFQNFYKEVWILFISLLYFLLLQLVAHPEHRKADSTRR